MECNCSTEGFNKEFGAKRATNDLKNYFKNGPKGNTKLLIDLLKSYDIKDKSLLDIGGGVGVIQFQLLDLGIKSVQSIDASQAYIKKAQEGAEKLGYNSQTEHIYGDFVQISKKINNAEIVTLDKVICCYKEFRTLVQESLNKTNEIYAIIIPRDVWWVKFFHSLETFIRIVMRSKFRSYIHSINEIESIIIENGFTRRSQRYQREWLVCIYTKDEVNHTSLNVST